MKGAQHRQGTGNQLIFAVGSVLVALLSVRIYSASVLRYGQRIRLKDMFKLSS